MTVLQKAVRNALVFYDDAYPHRWYDAIGPGVSKYIQNFETLASDDTTGDATEWQLNITEGAGTTTHVITDREGGALLITTGTNENDGINMQLGAAAGENMLLDGNASAYFGIRFALGDADQSDIFAGVGVTDTDWSGGVADALYFRSIDESALMYFVAENTNIESTVAVATLADATYITAEWLFDGTKATAYINGVSAGSVNNTDAVFPNDNLMRLTLEFLTGEANANTCTVEWLKCIYVK